MDGTCTTADAMTDQPETTPTNPEETPATDSSRKRSTNGRSRKSAPKRSKGSSRAKRKATQPEASEESPPAETPDTADPQITNTDPGDMGESEESVSPEAQAVEVPSDMELEADEAKTDSSEPTSVSDDEHPAMEDEAEPVADGCDEPISESGDETEPASPEEATETASSTDTADIEIHPNRVTEAILFCTDSPLPAAKIAKILGVGTAKDVKKHINGLNEEYAGRGMSFRIEEVAGGFQMLTLPAYNTWLSRVVKTRQETKLSPAAMETLSIVAYKQPCTRADVETIRGVAAGDMLNRLREMNLVKIVGRAEDLGRPLLYGTTRRFLEVFGLPSLEDLPTIEGVFAPPATEMESSEETAADPIAGAADGQSPPEAEATSEPAAATQNAPEEAVEAVQPPQETATPEESATPEPIDEEPPPELDAPANVQEVPVASVEAWPDAPNEEPVIESDAPPHLAIVTDDDDDDGTENGSETSGDRDEVADDQPIAESPPAEETLEPLRQGEHTDENTEDAPDTTAEADPRSE